MNFAVESLLKSMLKENTGVHMCDSGGTSGRRWQKNQDHNFDIEPECYADIHWFKEDTIWFEVTISIYHLLRQYLDLDEHCETFNGMEVPDWDGKYYGTSEEQCQWLDDMGFEKHLDYNTYNDETGYIHSQVTQGTLLTLNGEYYVLLQIHNGADVRGGYTDARLFYLDDEEAFYGITSADAGFYIAETDDEVFAIDTSHTYMHAHEGHPIDDEYLKDCCRALGLSVGDKTRITGDLYIR